MNRMMIIIHTEMFELIKFVWLKAVPVSKKVMKVKFENKKNLDLNDPAVMEAMLKQVNQVLYCFTFMKKQMR